MVLLLSEEDVRQLFPMTAALSAVEEAFRALAAGESQNQPRRRVRIRGGMLHNMSASLPSRQALGVKAYATVRGNASFLVALWDHQTGALKALIEGDRLGQIRTGAASGIATKYLARADAAVLGMIGTGWQARSQVEAICAAHPIKQVRVFGRDAERRQKFAEAMQQVIGVETIAAESAEAAVRDADVVATMTSSATPVLEGAWLKPGVHVNAAGSNATNRQEIDVATVKRADLIVVDQLEGAQLECGDLTAAVEAGAVSWDKIGEFGAIVTGAAPGRTNDQQITLFESQGLAVQDMAAAAYIYEQAKERGLGQEVDFLSGKGH
jgi:ornithine cyclodeaminase/alanine dehydrogenase-like protein (mu-crystallin family)